MGPKTCTTKQTIFPAKVARTSSASGSRKDLENPYEEVKDIGLEVGIHPRTRMQRFIFTEVQVDLAAAYSSFVQLPEDKTQYEV